VSDPKLSDAEQRYLQAIFDYWNQHGQWPTFNYMDRYIYQQFDLDAEDIAKSLANSLFGGFYIPSTTPDHPTGLPIRAIAYCEGGHHVLEVLLS
jgi:hypothetical protein